MVTVEFEPALPRRSVEPHSATDLSTARDHAWIHEQQRLEVTGTLSFTFIWKDRRTG